MMNEELHIQIFIDGEWKDAAKLIIDDPDAGRFGRITLDYELDFAVENLEQKGAAACSVRNQVMPFAGYTENHWFSFLDDIMPSGAGRRFWVQSLGIGAKKPGSKQDFELLKVGTIAPIGNMRIKESLPTDAYGNRIETVYFPLHQVLERHSDFLDHASSMGAVGGGATGAGGEAPKYTVRLNTREQVWIDAYQDDVANLDQHYLVKFPRGKQTSDDKDVLKAEAGYYRFLNEIGVLETIDSKAIMFFEEGERLSLWLPRFDVGIKDGKLVRYGMESVYSLMNKEPGTDLKHLDVIIALAAVLCNQEGGMTIQELATEWVVRDLLNVCLGNADNHGRNTSIIKIPDAPMRLAPVYDMAPMKADPEGIRRSTVWGAPYENGGNYDWEAIAVLLEVELSKLGYGEVEADLILERLEDVSSMLVGLEDKLRSHGVPDRILNFPSIGISTVEQRLRSWELLNDEG